MQIQGNDKTLNLFPESKMPSFSHRSSVDEKIFDKSYCLFGIPDVDIFYGVVKTRTIQVWKFQNGRAA